MWVDMCEVDRYTRAQSEVFFGFYVNSFEHENVTRYVPQLYYGLFCEENRKEFIENKMFA